MTRAFALLRGINVGRAKRVAMADLRRLMEELGFTDVRTLLNSGNVVFSTSERLTAATAVSIEQALLARTGVTSRVTLLSQPKLAAVAAANPLTGIASDPSRLMVTFLDDPEDRTRMRAIADAAWDPDRIVIGKDASYAWHPDGVLANRLGTAIGRIAWNTATARNWATVLKLLAAADPPRRPTGS
ncbi:MAG: DUF1697 domain-containing protein [Gemmatimonadota bacterium]